MNCLIGNGGNVIFGYDGINDTGIIVHGSGSDSICIILAPYVAGACGIDACVMVPIRLAASGGGHVELDIYLYIYIGLC